MVNNVNKTNNQLSRQHIEQRKPTTLEVENTSPCCGQAHKCSGVKSVNKGNNTSIELRTILQRERKTDKISQQPENCENRNDPDLVQAFLKKWWVESDFLKAQNLPLSLRLKVTGCHYNSIYNNT